MSIFSWIDSTLVDPLKLKLVTLLTILNYVKHTMVYRKHPTPQVVPTIEASKVGVFLPGGCSLMAYQLGFTGSLVLNSIHLEHIRANRSIVFEGYSSGALTATVLHDMVYVNKTLAMEELFEKVVAPLYARFKYQCDTPGNIQVVLRNMLRGQEFSGCLRVYYTELDLDTKTFVNGYSCGTTGSSHMVESLMGSIHIPNVTAYGDHHVLPSGTAVIDGCMGSILDWVADAAHANRVIIFTSDRKGESSLELDDSMHMDGDGFAPSGATSKGIFSKTEAYMFSHKTDAKILFDAGVVDATAGQARFDEMVGRLLGLSVKI